MSVRQTPARSRRRFGLALGSSLLAGLGVLIAAPMASAGFDCSVREESVGHLTSTCIIAPIDLDVSATQRVTGTVGGQTVDLSGGSFVSGYIGPMKVNLQRSALSSKRFSGKVGKWAVEVEPDTLFGGWVCTVYKKRWWMYRMTPRLVGEGYSLSDNQWTANCVALVSAAGLFGVSSSLI